MGIALHLVVAIAGSGATPFSELVGLNVSNTTVYLSGLVALLVFLAIRAVEGWEAAVVLPLKGVKFVRDEKQKMWDLRDRTMPK